MVPSLRTGFSLCLLLAGCLHGAEPHFAIQVVDADTGRGVPLVELETMDNQLYVTDSAGRIAFSEPGQMGVPVWFSMRTHGYDVPIDGFGMAGRRFTTTPGGPVTVKLKRRNIAERIVRLTGMGIYRDSVLLGEKVPLAEPLGCGGVVGQDSVHAVVYRGRIFWLWGDTMRLSYPLGNFRTVCAWSELPGKGGLPPSQGVNFRYFTGADGFAKEMCPLERKEGVVWLTGLAVVRDESGAERLIAGYSRRQGMEKVHEQGIAVFNDEKEIFERAATLPLNETWRMPHGHSTVVREGGTEYLYFGDASLGVRVPARLRDVLDPACYEAWTCGDAGGPRRRADGALDYAWRKDLPPIESPKEIGWLKRGLIKPRECRVTPGDVATKERVTLHAGTVRWNEYRKRWVLIAVQTFGKPSFLGEVWYAESEAPTGPWPRAVKVVTHDRYSFYNPAQHAFFDEEGGRFIYFEGTYSHTFSGNEKRTPRYDYNQMLYRLDLADVRLGEVEKNSP
ncbi:MAG: hypothetical protein ABMA01_08365 [Chthoniobacteraceae bacterium]